MAYNKVQMADGTVFIDLTSDTVTTTTLQTGVTAHDKSGAVITGTALEAESTALVKEDFDANGGIVKDITTVGNIPLTVVDTEDAGGGTIRTITSDNVVNLQAKNLNLTTAMQNVTSDAGWDGLSKIIINAATGVAYQDEDGYIILPKDNADDQMNNALLVGAFRNQETLGQTYYLDYYENTTYTGSLFVTYIYAKTVRFTQAITIPYNCGGNGITEILDLPNCTKIWGSNFAGNTTLQVLYCPKLKSIGANFFTAGSNRALIKMVVSTIPFTNTNTSSGSLRYSPNFKALVMPEVTSVPSLSSTQLTILSDYSGIGTNSDGYIYVPQALKSAFEEATNWSTMVGKFRAIEDYPLINAPTTWLPPEDSEEEEEEG